ncbi:MAG TPA: hypothetical protein VEA16_03575, partial [Vicinamibacterales bacterium]|nr:hypothetical protein [Vicinamibacterales bacterium]
VRDAGGVVIAYAAAHEIRLPRRDGSQIDAVIVADFVDERGRVAELEAQPGWQAYGNFLIREQLW